ncbi:hypothetical protein [Streptomyces sp. NBC_01320]|uniref:hypothetical protein n=1 Tax=Streptomyces sp. NBC_01320 TaxID=2903824 RepID=UPI002E0D4BAB|nr:hypothetical protein OG395_44890 [Streptomyces sp. NBC_01320]
MTQPPGPRAYHPDDHAALSDICVRTADNGGDSRYLYPDPELMPSIFATPYAYLEPDLAFVIDDGTGRAVGYILGTADTAQFVTAFRKRWLTLVEERFPEPDGPPRTPSEEMIALLHNPERMIVPEVADHPAHLHIDLLPAWQRKGFTTVGPAHRFGEHGHDWVNGAMSCGYARRGVRNVLGAIWDAGCGVSSRGPRITSEMVRGLPVASGHTHMARS